MYHVLILNSQFDFDFWSDFPTILVSRVSFVSLFVVLIGHMARSSNGRHCVYVWKRFRPKMFQDLALKSGILVVGFASKSRSSIGSIGVIVSVGSIVASGGGGVRGRGGTVAWGRGTVALSRGSVPS